MEFRNVSTIYILQFCFGVNILTVAMVVIWTINRHGKQWKRIHHSAKILFCILAAFGAFLALFDIIMLLRTKVLNGQPVPFHEWLYTCSQFSVWVAILMLSRCGTCLDVLCNGVLCFWWIIKLLLLIPRLQLVFSSHEVIRWTREICGAVADIMFGILINIIRMKGTSYGNRYD
ncbi:Xenobiotic-transporting ATPase [Handroanthus impetiginosus]|uniref:Xenobiotic-transporting ATPase n=1 Tax=Handroanthus impetiginosus TaxID=429701 RepID=A0A2G9GT37_9LAMI|nr:Xenobiotic-transporting ATPase [Handroanthus impetiginosus]